MLGLSVVRATSAEVPQVAGRGCPLILLHRGIAALALASPAVRIITTNYDLHLSSTLKAAGAEFDEYIGPALPMGDDFTGVVYLHGRLGRPAHQLVVTAEDFGRAYLRDAWAARFLERMFATFSVLFVGYSHGDVVMRYLARALGPGRKRYSLTDDAQAPEWTTSGITPLEYPNRLIAEEGVVGVCRFRGRRHGFQAWLHCCPSATRRAPRNELCTLVVIAQGMDHALQDPERV